MGRKPLSPSNKQTWCENYKKQLREKNAEAKINHKLLIEKLQEKIPFKMAAYCSSVKIILSDEDIPKFLELLK